MCCKRREIAGVCSGSSAIGGKLTYGRWWATDVGSGVGSGVVCGMCTGECRTVRCVGWSSGKESYDARVQYSTYGIWNGMVT